MPVLATTHHNRPFAKADADTSGHLTGAPFPAANGKLLRFPVAPATPAQRILAVEFRSAAGRCWNAIGGGATVAEAIVSARESCPDDATWNAISWNDLYGE